ncbi:hypothetical protein [Bdellovibrio sp. HCB209]|uniref:hypothetical protein n=1 Tax=Bdellovibrio sp. HCB209 TaxID=3394354 RepID=UPI0039B4EE55
MKMFFAACFLFASLNSFAATKNASEKQFSCTAEVFESFDDGSVRVEKIPLTVEMNNPARIIIAGDLDNRAFTLNGPKEGPYLISITEGPEYNKGSISTAEFSAEGRLQLSTVKGPLVHKIECFRK